MNFVIDLVVIVIYTVGQCFVLPNLLSLKTCVLMLLSYNPIPQPTYCMNCTSRPAPIFRFNPWRPCSFLCCFSFWSWSAIVDGHCCEWKRAAAIFQWFIFPHLFIPKNIWHGHPFNSQQNESKSSPSPRLAPASSAWNPSFHI